MRGKADTASEILKKITVITVFLLVLLQLTLFLIRALEPVAEQPVQAAVADTVFIHDTVFLYSRGRYGAGRSTRKAEDEIAGGNNNTRKWVDAPAVHPAVKVEAGADRWKWDVVELNAADSAQLDDIPGIGAYFARGIIRYRERLGGFVSSEQLMEIRGMDSSRFTALAPRVRVDTSMVRWIDLSCDAEETLAGHPYIGRMAARGIVRLRNLFPGERLTPRMLVQNGIMDEEGARRLWRYVKK